MGDTSWAKDGDGSESKEMVSCPSHMALPVLLRNHSAPCYATASGLAFPPPQARCPQMSTRGSEEPRHGQLLHKWDNFRQSIAGVKQHLFKDRWWLCKWGQPSFHIRLPQAERLSLLLQKAPLYVIFTRCPFTNPSACTPPQVWQVQVLNPLLAFTWVHRTACRSAKENKCWVNGLNTTTAAR